MKTVADILEAKGRAVWSVQPDASVYEALTLLAEKDVGALLVMEGDRLVGILSERDYARKVVLKGRVSRETPVREIMTSRVFFVRPEQTVDECMALMAEHDIRHLPVLDDDTVVGVISVGDVLRAIIAEKDLIIERLENYITGKEVYF